MSDQGEGEVLDAPGSPTGPEWTDSHPHLVFTAPYFAQVPLAEIFEPAIIDAAENVLPGLVQPAADAAADAAVRALGVLKAGDTMAGQLFLSELIPAFDSEAASKHYVDAMTAVSVPEAPVSPPNTVWGRELGTWVPVLPLTGGTLTGNLTLLGNAGAPLQPVPLRQLQAGWLPLTGGTLTGNLNMTSGADLHIAANSYLGGVLSVGGSGITTSGSITTTADLHAANAYATGSISAGGTVTGNAVNASGITSYGNAAVNGTLTAGAATISGVLSVGGSGITTTGNITAGADLHVTNAAYINSLTTTSGINVGSDLHVGGNSYFLGSATAPTFHGLLAGGEGNAGVLQCYNSANNVDFYWGPTGGGNTWLSYRVSGGTIVYPICSAINCQVLGYVGGLGPNGVALAGQDNSGTAYNVWVDTASDERIKHSIAPTQIDALALLEQVQVSEFYIKADAIAAIQPVPPEQKAELRTQPDAFVRIGLVAQQVLPLVPEIVAVTLQPEGHDPALPDDLHSLHEAAAVPYLIRAVQQLSAQVTALNARLQALEG
jgi:hypothetical protein